MANKRSRQRLWLKLDTSTGAVRVYAVRGFGLQGSCNPKTGVVKIKTSRKKTMCMTLMHELMHLALSVYSGDLRDAAGIGHWKKEERAISLLEPTLFALLTQNGLLSIPDPPKFK